MKQLSSVESERQQNSRSRQTENNVSPVSQAFVDNRESAAIQRQLMTKMTNSPQAIAQRKLSEQMHNSSRMSAQCKQMAKASARSVQRVGGEEELMQGKFAPIQRVEEEELLQGKFSTAQFVQLSAEKENNIGLPDNLKQGVENFPGMDMTDVRVHYNSSKALQLNALTHMQARGEKVEPSSRKQNASPNRYVFQRITNNGVAVDIATLTLVDARTHLGRLRRIRGITNAGGVVPLADVPYIYALTDEAALQLRIQTLEAAALEVRRLAVVAGLVGQLAALATVANWTNPPAWAGTTPTAADGGETIGATLLPAAVAARWGTFLGAGAYSHKHPRTGLVDATRLVSADGQRSIRYGNHEQNSSANQHHFHEETWTYTALSTTLTVANVLRRAPVT